MSNYFLKPLDPSLKKIIRDVIWIADKHHSEVYLVGGVVRDMLAKKKILDLDFMVAGSIDEIVSSLGRRLKLRVVYHPSFKTATLIRNDGHRIDFATTRQETYLSPGSLPVVREGALLQDLFRRDFTINAMALKINGPDAGALIDPFDGKEDLKKSFIRILHENSFHDDPTRLLRAVRFEQRFGFRMEKQTLNLFKKAVQAHVERTVKPPRYMAEFWKIFEEEAYVKCLRRMQALNLLRIFLPAQKLNWSLINKINNSLKKLKRNDRSSQIRFMGLMEMLPKSKIKRFCHAFHIQGELRDSSLQIREALGIIKTLLARRSKRSECYEKLKRLSDLTITYVWVRSVGTQAFSLLNRYKTKDSLTRLHITGKDVKSLGVQDGRKIGFILKRVLLRVLDGGFKNRQQQIKLAKMLSKEQV